MVVRELITLLGFEVSDKSINKAERRIQNFKKTARRAAGLISVAVLGIGGFALKAAADMEMLETQFEVMLGSAEKASKLMEKLKTFSAETPFALEDLAQGSQTLLSFGIAEEKVLNTMRMLGDTAGGNREKLNALVLAYGKVQTKGKASMEEINMIAERGVPIISTLQEQLGVTETEFFKLVSAGKIGRQQITQAFQTMTSEGGIFFQGMEKQSLTFTGMMSTLKDNLKLAAVAIGESLLPTAKDLMKTITDLVRGPLGELIKGLGGALKPILEVLGPVVGELSKVLLILAKPIQSILTFVANIVSKLLPPLAKILGVVSDLLSELFTDEMLSILDPIIEVIVLIVEIVAELLILLNPLLKFLVKLIGLGLNIYLKLVTVPLRIWLKILKGILGVIQSVISKLKDLIGPVIKNGLGKFIGIFDKISGKIQAFADNIKEKVIGSLIDLINWLNKIGGRLGIGPIKIPDSLDPRKQLQKNIENNTKNANVKMDINQSISTPPVAGGSGLTGDQLHQSMRKAAKSAFTVELKKVLISAI